MSRTPAVPKADLSLCKAPSHLGENIACWRKPSAQFLSSIPFKMSRARAMSSAVL